MHTIPVPNLSDADKMIGKIIADNLVEDGATLQASALDYSCMIFAFRSRAN